MFVPTDFNDRQGILDRQSPGASAQIPAFWLKQGGEKVFLYQVRNNTSPAAARKTWNTHSKRTHPKVDAPANSLNPLNQHKVPQWSSI